MFKKLNESFKDFDKLFIACIFILFSGSFEETFKELIRFLGNEGKGFIYFLLILSGVKYFFPTEKVSQDQETSSQENSLLSFSEESALLDNQAAEQILASHRIENYNLREADKISTSVISHFNTVVMEELCKLKNITILSLEYTPVNLKGLQKLRELRHLKALSLKNTPVTDEMLGKSLPHLNALKSLSLENCYLLKGLFLNFLKDNLEELNIEFTSIPSKNLDYLHNKKGLKILRISYMYAIPSGNYGYNRGRLILLERNLPNCKIIVHRPPCPFDKFDPPESIPPQFMSLSEFIGPWRYEAPYCFV